jgi:DNA polymerase III delta subunit
MITILHGDNFVASRNALKHQIDIFKSQSPTANLGVKRFAANKLEAATLTQILESTSLFGQDQLLVISNLLGLPQSQSKDQLIKILLNNQNQPICLWEKKTLSASLKKQFLKATIKEFKTPKIVFKFLDSLKPNNSQTSLKLLHQSYQKDAPELIFYLLGRRLSQLIQAKDSADVLKGAPWQINKLKAQAKNFTLNQLLNLHQKLLNLDLQIKTGQTDLSLSCQLDLLLARL